MPLFSVIVPVYKVETTLDECVRSVLGQTFRDLELILVDDGSPDGCPAMCDAYAADDDRVKVVHQVNGGLSSARNAGLKVARGEYVLFLDSDDRFRTPEGFGLLARRVRERGEDVIQYASEDLDVASGARQMVRGDYDHGVIDRGDKEATVAYLFSGNKFPGSAWIMAVRRSLLVANAIDFKLGVTAEDYAYIMKVVYYARSYGAIDGLVYEYKKGVAGSITSRARESGLAGIDDALAFWRSKNDLPRGLNEMAAFIYLVMLINYGGLSKEVRRKWLPKVKADADALSRSKRLRSRLAVLTVRLIGVRGAASLIRLLRR